MMEPVRGASGARRSFVLVALVLFVSAQAVATGLDSLPPHTCVAPSRPSSGGPIQVALETVISNTGSTRTLALEQSPVDPTIRYAASRSGQIYRVSGCCSFTTALDISSQINSSGEGGMVGLALHPSFASNGEIFVYYTAPGGATTMATVVSRFRTFDGGMTFSPTSEEVILTFDQPTVIHNAGDIHFGADGFLYIGLGDGGVSANAQDTSNLLGAFLRIDVDGAAPYSIPPGNPFASGGGAPEIWAWGMRNPYRWAFDPDTGVLWAGDVGQALQEEIDHVVGGANYGWPIREGDECFSGDCGTPGLTDPVLTYPHSEGCAIIGGRVYRGSSVPALDGAYIYGDYCSRQIWAALPDGSGGLEPVPIATVPSFMAAFAQDSDGEVMVLSGRQALRFVPDTTPPVPFPEKLTDTGCVDPQDPSRPAAGMIEYSVNQKLWSDGAEKTRWFSIPPGETIQVASGDGDLDLPIGSVAVKTFFLEDEPFETRLFVRHDDGGWAGYSYEWDPDGMDATLLEEGKTKTIEGQEWTYPSRPQCLQCHGFASGYTLGLELGQLNRPHFYESTGRTANQLETLDYLGLLSPALAAEPGELPAYRGDTLNEAARGYLHANCSNCHRTYGGSGVGIDLRYQATNMKICEWSPAAGNLGVPGSRLLKVGDPALSILSLRMHLVGTDQMPPLGKSIADPAGTALIDEWIQSWVDCTDGPDSDGDGVADSVDNCVTVHNPTQSDSVGNGIGDDCRTPCNDGVDNDNDGSADYPHDAGCSSLLGTLENPACQDGADNDGDGRTDSPFDLGCEGPSSPLEFSTCEDGVDNNNDGLIDWDGAGVGDPDPTCEERPFNAEWASVPAIGILAWTALVIALASGRGVRRRLSR